MKKPTIRKITVKSLITFFLVMLMFLATIIGINFRNLSNQAIINQAFANAKLVEAGLTAHMKAGMTDKRDFYLHEIRQLYDVKQLRLVAAQVILDQYGKTRDQQASGDFITDEVFASGEPRFEFNEFSTTPFIRAVIPYIASKRGSLDCLECHQVEEGTVLGVVDIELDVSQYQHWSLFILAVIVFVFLIFLLLILLNTSRTIKRYVQDPLNSLIKSASVAYQSHQPVSTEQFLSAEFDDVAEEINLFNADVIAHQDQMRDKNIELTQLNHEIESTLRETLYTMGVIEEQRSKESHNHTMRVTLYSKLLAQYAGLSVHDIGLLSAASPLHDIGKIGIPDSVLLKPGKLDNAEYATMQTHTRIGNTMLKHSQRDVLQAAAIIAFQHHERWDGSGYPQGLAGNNIHRYARIVAIVDVFDALYSARIYKKAWSTSEVVSYLAQEQGKQFDPEFAALFIDHIDEFIDIYQQHPGTA